MSRSRMKPAEARDLKYMREALREARRGYREAEVPVGAVVVRDGQVIARAHNRSIHLNDPAGHAEVLALRRAARKLGNYRLVGCTLYVTIEPCVMCVGAIVQARLRRLVIGAQDAKAGACGTALAVLNDAKLNHQVEVQNGVLAQECAGMLREFFRQRRSKNPSSLRTRE